MGLFYRSDKLPRPPFVQSLIFGYRGRCLGILKFIYYLEVHLNRSADMFGDTSLFGIACFLRLGRQIVGLVVIVIVILL